MHCFYGEKNYLDDEHENEQNFLCGYQQKAGRKKMLIFISVSSKFVTSFYPEDSGLIL